MENNSINISKKICDNHNKKYLILLVSVTLSAFLLRFIYFEPKIPLTFDSLGYFFYALDTSVLGYLPPNYTPVNNGWPIFLSVFFSLSPSEDVFSYMQTPVELKKKELEHLVDECRSNRIRLVQESS